MKGKSGDCGCAAVAGRLLTLREMAGLLAVTPEGLRRRVHLDGIPHVRVGTELRFDQAAVVGFLSRGGGGESGVRSLESGGREGGRQEDKASGTLAVRKTDVSDRVHGKSVTRAGA